MAKVSPVLDFNLRMLLDFSGLEHCLRDRDWESRPHHCSAFDPGLQLTWISLDIGPERFRSPIRLRCRLLGDGPQLQWRRVSGAVLSLVKQVLISKVQLRGV